MEVVFFLECIDDLVDDGAGDSATGAAVFDDDGDDVAGAVFAFELDV